MKEEIYNFLSEIVKIHGCQLNVDEIEIVVPDEFNFEIHFANGSTFYTTMFDMDYLYPAVEDAVLYGRWDE